MVSLKTGRAGSARPDIGVLGVSVGLIAIAAMVLIGWHAHIRTAIQIFPGLIPMQYNTALCFMALGAAGIGLVTRRRWLLACGGSVAGLMGAVVIVEYATGRSSGIDTLFFYPWERTLSADPGRMTIATATSFVLTGSGLVYLAFRSNAYAVFGLLNSVAVSLALTSLIGYAFQTAFELPFSPGSQMALATGVAFLAFGSAALGYSWRRAECGSDGMPQWTAGLGLAFLPTLLVGASAIFPTQSGRIVSLKILLSIAGVALIGAALQKMTAAKVANKGLAIAAVPLLLLVVLVGMVAHLESENESAQGWALHSAEVLLETQSLLTHLAAADSAAGSYAITGDVAFVAPHERAAAFVVIASRQLVTLVSDNPIQEAQARTIGQLGAEYVLRLGDRDRLIQAGRRPGTDETLTGGIGSESIKRVRAAIETFSNEEERLATERRQGRDTSRHQLNWLLVSGTAGAILQASLLGFSFYGSIGGRLQQLRRNAIGLAAGQPPASRLAGSDELADLDRVFQEMAASLAAITRREKAIIAGATDGIVIKDLDHRYVLVNAWTAKTLGTTVDEMVGASIFDLYDAATAQRIVEFDNMIIAGGETATYELEAATKAGESRIYSSTYLPFRDKHGAVVGVITMSRDITLHKRHEAALAQIGIDQLRFKDEFLSHVSHELRSPLAAIKEFSSILRDELSGPLNSDQHHSVRIILKNVQQQQSMIDDLLEVTRLGAGKLMVAPGRMSVLDAVTDSVDTLQGAARTKQVTVSSDVAPHLPSVYADQTRLRQILIILLDNAIKFTPQGGAIRVGARLLPQDSQFVILEVSDTGAGMSPEVAERVFERLYQEGTSGRPSHKGLGLGLYISKELVTRQGGRIWVESRPQQGSTFSFTLPVFSLASVIGPLLTNGKWPGETVALVKVEVCRPTPWPSRAAHETWSLEIRSLLERCLMPDMDVLLPGSNSDTDCDCFFVAAFAEHTGASVLANRIRTQIERLRPFSELGLTLSVTHTLIESLPSDQSASVETIVTDLAARLESITAQQRTTSVDSSGTAG